jgi:hypothetical protein
MLGEMHKYNFQGKLVRFYNKQLISLKIWDKAKALMSNYLHHVHPTRRCLALDAYVFIFLEYIIFYK